MAQRTSKENKLERDSEGKPKITLSELEKTAVHTPTQKKYITLMQVYECGGWVWCDGDLPTQGFKWITHTTGTCVKAKNRFTYAAADFGFEKYKIITTQEFYNMQKITPEMLREVNNYFEN